MTSSMKTIDNCPHNNPLKHAGFLVCRDCGLVLDQVIEPNTVLTQRTAATHHGKSFLFGELHDPIISIGYRTCIGNVNERNQEFFRMNKWHKSLSGEGRAFRKAYILLKQVSDSLSLSSLIFESSMLMFRKIYRKMSMRGRPYSAFLACCILYSSRTLESKPISFRDLINMFKELDCDISGKKVLNVFKVFKEFFPKNVIQSEDLYLPQILSKLSNRGAITQEEQNQIQLLSQDALHLIPGIIKSGKMPLSIISAVLCQIGGQKYGLKQKLLAEVCKVSQATLRNNLKLIKPYLEG